MYHSTLGLRVIKQKRREETLVTGPLPSKETLCSVITGSFMLPENALVSEKLSAAAEREDNKP